MSFPVNDRSSGMSGISSSEFRKAAPCSDELWTCCFVLQRNQLKEPNEPFEPSHLQAQPELTCRITDYSPLEQLHLISLRK